VFAGLDPSGRAGLLADGEAIRAQGAEPVLCATAIAAQSQNRLVRASALPPEDLAAQAEGALEDGALAAVKVGMVGSRAVLGALLQLLDGPLRRAPLVFDPVLSTSRGGSLFDGEVDELLPLVERAALVTPNLSEVGRLTGMEVQDEALMYEAASRLALRGAKAVLLKGGHLAGAPADLLLCGDEPRWFRGARVKKSKRGTGCRLASATAAGLAVKLPLEDAVERGIAYVRSYLSA
jgi:hydroxymethylpyrimidine/phosphomethylpyrimidine kinase